MISSFPPESFATQYFLTIDQVDERLDVDKATLHRNIFPYLHSLAVPKTRTTLYAKSYTETLVSNWDHSCRLSTFAKTFAQQPIATELISNTEQAFNAALEDKIININGQIRVINAAGVVSLLGISPSTVKSWSRRGLLTPTTLSGDPHRRFKGAVALFPEHHFLSLIAWHRPLSERL